MSSKKQMKLKECNKMADRYAYTYDDAALRERAKRLLSKFYPGSRPHDYSKTMESLEQRGLTK